MFFLLILLCLSTTALCSKAWIVHARIEMRYDFVIFIESSCYEHYKHDLQGFMPDRLYVLIPCKISPRVIKVSTIRSVNYRIYDELLLFTEISSLKLTKDLPDVLIKGALIDNVIYTGSNSLSSFAGYYPVLYGDSILRPGLLDRSVNLTVRDSLRYDNAKDVTIRWYQLNGISTILQKPDIRIEFMDPVYASSIGGFTRIRMRFITDSIFTFIPGLNRPVKTVQNLSGLFPAPLVNIVLDYLPKDDEYYLSVIYELHDDVTKCNRKNSNDYCSIS